MGRPGIRFYKVISYAEQCEARAYYEARDRLGFVAAFDVLRGETIGAAFERHLLEYPPGSPAWADRYCGDGAPHCERNVFKRGKGLVVNE